MTLTELRAQAVRLWRYPYPNLAAGIEEWCNESYDGTESPFLAVPAPQANALLALAEACEAYAAKVRLHGRTSSSDADAIPGQQAVEDAHAAMLAASARLNAGAARKEE